MPELCGACATRVQALLAAVDAEPPPGKVLDEETARRLFR